MTDSKRSRSSAMSVTAKAKIPAPLTLEQLSKHARDLLGAIDMTKGDLESVARAQAEAMTKTREKSIESKKNITVATEEDKKLNRMNERFSSLTETLNQLQKEHFETRTQLIHAELTDFKIKITEAIFAAFIKIINAQKITEKDKEVIREILESVKPNALNLLNDYEGDTRDLIFRQLEDIQDEKFWNLVKQYAQANQLAKQLAPWSDAYKVAPADYQENSYNNFRKLYSRQTCKDELVQGSPLGKTLVNDLNNDDRLIENNAPEKLAKMVGDVRKKSAESEAKAKKQSEVKVPEKTIVNLQEQVESRVRLINEKLDELYKTINPAHVIDRTAIQTRLTHADLKRNPTEVRKDAIEKQRNIDFPNASTQEKRKIGMLELQASILKSIAAWLAEADFGNNPKTCAEALRTFLDIKIKDSPELSERFPSFQDQSFKQILDTVVPFAELGFYKTFPVAFKAIDDFVNKYAPKQVEKEALGNTSKEDAALWKRLGI